MLAAGLTVWILFSFWLIAACLPATRELRRIAICLLCVELGVLLLWSYGTESCEEPGCAPLAQAAGVAARLDVPVLSGVFLAGAIVQMGRRSGSPRTAGHARG
jgi:hypothetical protein